MFQGPTGTKSESAAGSGHAGLIRRSRPVSLPTPQAARRSTRRVFAAARTPLRTAETKGLGENPSYTWKPTRNPILGRVPFPFESPTS